MASAEPLVPCSPEASTRSNKSKFKRSTRILHGVTIATAGSLGPGWTDTDVARWMGYNGGRFVAALSDKNDDGVTHVLSTLEEFSKPKKKQCTNLRRALDRGTGKRGVHIVLQDWLEDSLYKRRRLRETRYLLRNVNRESKQAPEERQKKLAEQQARGQSQAETFINTDCTGFSYKVTISRDHEAAGILGERYLLYLFESHAKPPLYWFAARHYKSRKHSRPLDFRPSGSCGLFATEFAHFSLPVVSTLISTRPDEPVDPILPMVETAAQSVARMMSCINGGTYEASAATTSAYFKYERPVKGQPVGAIENEENLPPEVDKLNSEGAGSRC
ncbi:brct domain containing protein [Ophiostoma piceae UAMH 11346]|uniref:Brct domain containing protein n=1 Tax=Ophiostoma piceae (strain UAMH 11346) TaxID=1262450 RepID=S3BPR6_OPHP1|nr:brct domain containing protein [Ophiostoma piceae UAMH 11346]